MPSAVLFDMDGVLVKSEDAWFHTVAQAGVRFRGRAITREEFTPTFGQGTVADLPAFRLSCTAQELDDFYAQELPRHLDQVWVNPAAEPVLEALRARHIACAVVTNTIGSLAQAILERAKLRSWFGSLATADRVAESKPAPDLIFLACRELGVSPAEALFIGDTKFDRGAAKAAGVRFVGLGIPGDVRIDRLEDLPGVL